MMINIAAHVRIFDPDPEDDLVTKRTSAIRELASRFAKARNVSTIFKSANDLAWSVDVEGGNSEALAKDIEAAVRKFSKAFISDGHELQTTVCGLLAALQLLDRARPSAGGLKTSDMYAIGLWLALSFQVPRRETNLEALRVELLQKAQEVALKSATSARRRSNVPDAYFEVPREFEPAKLREAFTKGTKDTIEALRANAALDREEIDLLWWVMGDWSELLGCKFSAAANPAAAVASGLEAGRMLRRLPADSHHHLVLRHVSNTDPVSLPELLNILGGDRAQLAAPYEENANLSACPLIFPLLAALRSGSATDAKAQVKRPLRDWADRAFLESAALHLTAHIPSVAI